MLNDGMAVSSLNWAKKHKREFDRVISVCDPSTHPNRTLTFSQHPKLPHLTLRFADLDTRADGHYADFRDARLASEDDVAKALAFDVPGERLLVHCKVGISRSTSLAYAILCQRAGPGREQEAFNALLELQPDAVPNLHVVAIADRLLGRNLAMFVPIAANEARRPECAERRVENRRAYHAHFERGGSTERFR